MSLMPVTDWASVSGSPLVNEELMRSTMADGAGSHGIDLATACGGDVTPSMITATVAATRMDPPPLSKHSLGNFSLSSSRKPSSRV
jgi:hypothetical protein